MICINCDNEHDSKFCPNCGEKASVPKITFSSIFNDGFSTITNMDKGFLFNVKNLFYKPNEMVNAYINGKRKGVFNPISFLIIAITIYLITESLIPSTTETSTIDSNITSIGYRTGYFIRRYFKYFWIFSVVWLSVATKLIFGEYNFAEHLAINSFVIGQATLVGLISFLATKFMLLFNPFVYLTIIWMTYQIFKKKNNDLAIFSQSLSAVVLFFSQLAIILVLIGIIHK